MGRSRSRSPTRRRKRAKERDRSLKKKHKNRSSSRRRSNSRDSSFRHREERLRSRSRSFERRHHSSPHASSSSKSKIPSVPTTVNTSSCVSEADLAGKTQEEIQMMKVMGFCGFDTTKGKKVEGNDVGDVHVILKRKYRQYMNRKGGFNRPLDFVA